MVNNSRVHETTLQTSDIEPVTVYWRANVADCGTTLTVILSTYQQQSTYIC